MNLSKHRFVLVLAITIIASSINAQSINVGSWFNQYYFQLTWISHLDFRIKKE